MLRDRSGSDGPRLAVDLGLERRAAAAVAGFIAKKDILGWPNGVACGPLMLARTPGPAAVLIAAVAGASEAAAERVRLLLSPLGRGCYLLEQSLFEEAVAELEPHAATSQDARERYREALVRLAVEQAGERRWGAAITSFIRAAEEGADVRRHAAVLRDVASARMREIVAGDEDNYRLVVEMLDAVRPLVPGDPTFDADSAASYAELARQLNNSHDYEQAVELLDKALNLMPDDPAIRRIACVATQNLADDLLDEGTAASVQRAFGLLDRSRSYDDGEHNPAERVCLLLLNKALGLMERARLDIAVTVAREALRHDDVPLGWRVLADVHVRRGRRSDACAALLDGRRRHPRDIKLRDTHRELCK
jgi:tetratricopeptide (TPR) repeat protein